MGTEELSEKPDEMLGGGEEGRRGGGLWYNLQWLPSHQEVAVLLVTTSEEICCVNLPVFHLMSLIEKSVQLKWNFKIIDYR